jgi:hypothetical protein
MGYVEIDYDEDGNPDGSTWVKEEPDCGECCDSGHIAVPAAGQPDGTDLFDVATCTTTCPGCNSSPEQAAVNEARARAYDAEFAARVARGEASYDDEPPF